MRLSPRLGPGRRLLVAVVVGCGLFAVATAVQASIPDASGVIHGCYNTSTLHGNPIGGVRVIDTSRAGGVCAGWEMPLSWNVKGPTGSVGPTGAKGAPGPAGPIGATGPIGPSNAYTEYGSVHDLADGDRATIMSVTLPIGRYTLAGDAEFSDDLGVGGAGAEVQCGWSSSATVHGFGADGLGYLDDMPVYGDVDVASNNTAVNLDCSDAGPDPIEINGSLIATKVGAVTPAS